PMVLGGDEIGRSQGGNNNAYCQDNQISWFDWSLRDENLALLGFARELMEFRRAHPVFHRRRWFMGRALRGTDASDIEWFDPSGEEMTEEQWDDGFAKSLAVFLNGEGITSRGPRGERITDDSFMLLFNAHDEPIAFTVPTGAWGEAWNVMIDTNEPLLEEGARTHKAGEQVSVEGRSVVVLIRAA
ncbi:MAG: glycogen debranching enzyme, partial [Actinomycetota bacterium]